MGTRSTIFDDIDNSEPAKKVTFSLNGSAYDIDLSEAHVSELQDALAPFVAAARTAEAPQARSRSTKSPTRSQRGRTVAVRAWAQENGVEVATRGRIPEQVMEAYDNAHA